MDSRDVIGLYEAYLEVHQLDEKEKPFPYGEVGDKLRSLHTKLQTTNNPEEQNKIYKRQQKINKEYNLPMEQVDLYDVVLDHLLDEGYCDDVESAEVIMANMSEEWLETITEGKKKVINKLIKLGRESSSAPTPEARAKIDAKAAKLMDKHSS